MDMTDVIAANVATFGHSAAAARVKIDGSAVAATVEHQGAEIVYDDDGERLVERATVQLDPTDAPDLHIDETLSIDGVTWAVSSIPSREPVLSIEVQRTLQRKVGGAQSRIDR
ncbi:MAG TPA: hypothetical protein VMW48_03520 [Vicinamibacterales bacterium]|nr:hypothetical protein [Vicinamibacterales bacterium]